MLLLQIAACWQPCRSTHYPRFATRASSIPGVANPACVEHVDDRSDEVIAAWNLLSEHCSCIQCDASIRAVLTGSDTAASIRQFAVRTRRSTRSRGAKEASQALPLTKKTGALLCAAWPWLGRAIATVAPMYRAVTPKGLCMQRNSTVQTRGRVTIPLSVRKSLRVSSGDDVVFVQTAPGRFELKAEARKAALLNRTGVGRTEAPVCRGPAQTGLLEQAGR